MDSQESGFHGIRKKYLTASFFLSTIPKGGLT